MPDKKQVEIDDDLIAYLRDNDGELPEGYLADIDIIFPDEAFDLPYKLGYSMLAINLKSILRMIAETPQIVYILVLCSLCAGITIWLVTSPSSDDNSNSSGTPRPKELIKELIIVHYEDDTMRPDSVPCQITNLSTRPAAIYAEPDRVERIESFEQNETLQVVGDGNQQWYEVKLADGSLGWFYYLDTNFTADYCE